MMAQGWNLNPVFFGYFKDVLTFFALNFFAVERKRDHQ
jgi:hypothetical protein